MTKIKRALWLIVLTDWSYLYFTASHRGAPSWRKLAKSKRGPSGRPFSLVAYAPVPDGDESIVEVWERYLAPYRVNVFGGDFTGRYFADNQGSRDLLASREFVEPYEYE